VEDGRHAVKRTEQLLCGGRETCCEENGTADVEDGRYREKDDTASMEDERPAVKNTELHGRRET
jgi:hypothetical protein